MIDLDKFYKIARSKVGELGPDLVHTVYLKTFDLLHTKENPEGYFHKVLLNELKKGSTFRKQYDRQEFEELDQLEADLLHVNTLHLEAILTELHREGRGLEVNVFREVLREGKSALCKKTGVRYDIIIKICTFVTNEVKLRYDNNLR